MSWGKNVLEVMVAASAGGKASRTCAGISVPNGLYHRNAANKHIMAGASARRCGIGAGIPCCVRPPYMAVDTEAYPRS